VTKTAQLALALLGTTITVGVMQYARNVDPSVAAPAGPAFRIQTSDGGAGNVGPRVGGDPDGFLLERNVRVPVEGPRPSGGPDRSNDVRGEEATEPMDTQPEPETVLGFQLPAWLETLLGRRSSVAGGVAPRSTEPLPSTTPPSGTPASAIACNHDVAPNPQGITAQVEFVGVLLDGGQRAGDSFSAAELDDLKILVDWKSLFQNHAQRIDLIAPDGSLYQSLSRLVTAADVGALAETRVPVNGSWITRHGLYGSWCVEVFIDQESAPVVSSRLVIARPQ
jgi:hypothetical protein